MLLQSAKPDDTFGRGGAVTSQLCSKCDPVPPDRGGIAVYLSIGCTIKSEDEVAKNVPARFR